MTKLVKHGEMSSEPQRSAETCGYCGGRILKDYERGQYVCRSCGTVVSDNALSTVCEANFPEISQGAACYAMPLYGVGPPTTLAFHDLGISTEITLNYRDGKGKPLAGKARYRAMILRSAHSRTRTKDGKDLGIAKALSVLNDLADRLELPAHVREEASGIYRRIAEKRLTIGRSKQSLVAVSVYAAIRRAKLPIMLRDVLPILAMDKSEFNLCLNVVKRMAGIEVPPPDPVAWIPKIASECHFSQSCQLLAAKYVRSMIKSGETFGFLPHVVATIALFRMGALTGERKNVYEVARLANCAATSILKGFVSDSEAQRSCKKGGADTSQHRARVDAPNLISSEYLCLGGLS